MDDWKKELQDINKEEQSYKEEQKLYALADKTARDLNKVKAKEFIQNTIIPAFNELVKELKKYVEKAWWDGGDLDTHLRIQFKNGGVIAYSINLTSDKRIITAQKKCKVVGPRGRPSYESTSPFPAKHNGIATTTDNSNKEMDLFDVTKAHIIDDFMTEYKNYKRQELQ